METSNTSLKFGIKNTFSFAANIYRDSFFPIFAIVLLLFVVIDTLGFFLEPNIATLGYPLIAITNLWLVYSAYKLSQQGAKPTFSTVSRSLNEFAPYIGKFFVTFILANVLVFLLTLLLIVPGIIFFVYWIFSYFVVFDKNLSAKKALDYSKSIVKGNWLNVFFLLIILAVIGNLAIFLITFLSTFIIVMSANTFVTFFVLMLINIPISAVITLTTQTLFAAYLLLNSSQSVPGQSFQNQTQEQPAFSPPANVPSSNTEAPQPPADTAYPKA